jgi:LSD1 subclass zinc finger protein
MSGTDLETWRCPNCRRILAKVRLASGSTVEVKCHACNALNTLVQPFRAEADPLSLAQPDALEAAPSFASGSCGGN